MKVIADRGGSQYLLKDGNVFYLLDSERMILFSDVNVQMIIGRGYWDDWEGSESQEKGVLAMANAAEKKEWMRAK